MAEQCKRAVRSKISPHGHRLYKLTENHFRTKDFKSYGCTWMKHTDNRFWGFDVKVYTASISSGEDLVHQGITSSRCKVQEGHCVPLEDKNRIILYDKVPKLKGEYRSLGDQEVIMAMGIASIPKLGTGGGIARYEREKWPIWILDIF